MAANSKREFEARKQVLGVELELLRIRGMEKREGLENLQEAARREAEAQILSNSSGMNGGNPLDPSIRDFVYGGPRTVEDVLGTEFGERNEERLLAMRRLKAEIELTEIAADEAKTALDSVFQDVAGGGAVADAVDRAGGGGGGGGGRSSAAAKAMDDIAKSAERVSQHADALSSSFSDTFASIVTGADDAGEALSRLAMQWASTLAQQGFETLFDSVFDSVMPNAKGNAFLHGQVTPFANGGVVNSPTLFPMAKGVGLMGEAGPEAVMPLRRGSNGKLGVEASGGGGTVEVLVRVDDDGRLRAFVERTSGTVAATVVGQYDRHMPERVAGISRDRRARY